LKQTVSELLSWITRLTLSPPSGQTVKPTNQLLYVNGKLVLLAIHGGIKVLKKCVK